MIVPQKIKTRKKKLKLELYDPANLLLGIYLEESKARYQRDIFIPMFTAALFTIAKMWKKPNIH